MDLSCIEIGPGGWQHLWADSAPYPSDLRKQVLKMQEPGQKRTLKELLLLDANLGEWFGKTLQKKISKQKRKPQVIANHGQTLAHHPQPGTKPGVTLQLGDPTRVAFHTSLTTIALFRNGDMAAGGQGAPLLPLFHRLIAHALGFENGGIALHNIGGISNLTYVGRKNEILAFDTGPGNIWIDAAAQTATRGRLKMDVGGRLARQGQVNIRMLKAALRNPYFSLRAPKSTGRDDFTLTLFNSLANSSGTKGNDLVATATAITAESIARAYEDFILKRKLPLREILICGGGAKNPSILAWIQKRLPQIEVSTLSDKGYDSQLIESQGFAYFGYLSLLGLPIGGSWTGAGRGFAPPAHIIPGKNWSEILSKIRDIRFQDR
jgi:anhydro-N-acetylmuramic acid kinase